LIIAEYSGVNIMYIKIDVNTEIEIKILTNLSNLKIFMESLNIKIHRSQLVYMII